MRSDVEKELRFAAHAQTATVPGEFLRLVFREIDALRAEREELGTREYATRLSGARIGNLERAAVAALLEEYRAELARDPAFVLSAVEQLLREAGVCKVDLPVVKTAAVWCKSSATGEWESARTLPEAYAKLLAARKPAGEEGG
jgi:hypothetical protein